MPLWSVAKKRVPVVPAVPGAVAAKNCVLESAPARLQVSALASTVVPEGPFATVKK